VYSSFADALLHGLDMVLAGLVISGQSCDKSLRKGAGLNVDTVVIRWQRCDKSFVGRCLRKKIHFSGKDPCLLRIAVDDSRCRAICNTTSQSGPDSGLSLQEK